MTTSRMYDSTARRLRDYNLFSEQTIDAIATLAQTQASYESYKTFFHDVGVGEPVLFQPRRGSGVPVVDVPARQDEKGTIAVHLPMANPLDPNQLFQIATIAAANPEYRVIGFGNPSSKPYFYKEQNLTLRQRFSIATSKDKRALVRGELDYLSSHAITNVTHAGYSYGALKALIATYYAPIETTSGAILVDPVAHPRGLRQLLGDFSATFGPLGKYVNRTNLDIFFQARKASGTTGWKYRPYVRPINIAIGFLLSRVDFMQLLKKDIVRHSDGRFSVAWGTKSELGNDAHMYTSLDALAKTFLGRLKQLRLKDDAHALANDVHLHAAIIYESLHF